MDHPVKIQSSMPLLRDCLPIFVTLGDEKRQAIMSLLFEHGPLNVSELTAHLAISRPAVSHHLKLLLQAGVVQVRQQGKERYYALNIEEPLRRLQALTASLEANYEFLRSRTEQP